ncbi:MAG: trypsin-like peptidase domain-containing protein, partial [Oscillibacter sp.]|nr:trypsin-like peptidase domain-containing protein [Oscillibacter sp.]
MKKRLFSLLCAAALLCTSALLFLQPSAQAADGAGQKAADSLVSIDFLSVQSAGILDTKLIGENLYMPSNQLVAVSLLIRMSGEDTSSARPVQMAGVPADSARDVAFAIDKGWVDGISFEADSPISANDWFAMVLKMLGYSGIAADEAPLFARRIGLVPREYKGNLTGADLAESALAILRFPYKDGTGTVTAKLVLKGVCTAAAFNVLGIAGRDLSVSEVADRSMAAVFGLDLELVKSGPDGETKSKASGFFVTPDGVAVTCFHALQGVSGGTAVLITGEQFDVQSVLWTDEASDLALIRISKTSKEGKTAPAFAYLETGRTDELRPGAMSYAFGCPLGKGLSISQGVVSSVGVQTERYSLPCIVSAAPISPGSGGGALISTAGTVIGVTAGAFRDGNEMYLSIPADMLADTIKSAGGGGQPLSAFGSANPKPELEKTTV